MAMNFDWVAIGAATWLGLLTAISPCPLATNIAAISFVSRHCGNRRGVLGTGLSYAAGRTIAYIALGLALYTGLMAGAEASRFLQRYMNEILGPVLVLLGMVLLGMIGSGVSWNLIGDGIQKRAAKGGMHWALVLGMLFALSFCPVSAGLFFAGLVPLSIKEGSPVLLPALYGLGTALPVIAFAFVITFAADFAGKAFHRLGQIEKFLRFATGCVFILVGIYYCLTHIYSVSFA